MSENPLRTASQLSKVMELRSFRDTGELETSFEEAPVSKLQAVGEDSVHCICLLQDSDFSPEAASVLAAEFLPRRVEDYTKASIKEEGPQSLRQVCALHLLQNKTYGITAGCRIRS